MTAVAAEEHRYPALAEAAARVATAGSPAVSFTVTHASACARSSTVAAPGDDGTTATETLAFYLADLGFLLHTWPSRLPTVPAGGASVHLLPADGEGTQRFHGTVGINLDFLYDTARGSEILVTFDHDRWRPDYRDTLVVARAYEVMTAAAHDAGIPVLFLQSPVSPFHDPPRRFRLDGSGEAPRVANAMAVRMLAGFDDDPGKRHDVVDRIAAMAADLGLGLQLSDRRFGKVRGEWWSVLGVDTARYERRKQELFGWAQDGAPDSVRLLTFVGPARVGSTASIVSDLAARNVGIVAVSEASLQQLAFINLVVPTAPARSAKPATTGPVTLPLDEGLGLIARDCGLTTRQRVRDKHRRPGEQAVGYQVLCSGPVTLPADTGTVYRPLWLSWELPAVVDTDVALETMAIVLGDPQVTDVRLDYLRARTLPTGRRRGRAKISVALAAALDQQADGEQVPPTLGRLCAHAQREVTAKLGAGTVPSRAVSVRIAWRERWIGGTAVV